MGSKKNIDIEVIIFGCFMVVAAVFELSTFYVTNKYLIPYSQINILRNIYEVGAFPIVIGIWGLKIIFRGFNPVPASKKQKSKSENNQKNGEITYLGIFISLITIFGSIAIFTAIPFLVAEMFNYPLPPRGPGRITFVIVGPIIGIFVGILILKKLNNKRFFRA